MTMSDAFSKNMVPPELAEQVALALRILHESPEIEECKETPRSSAKVTRIVRDEEGNFVPVYDEDEERPSLEGLELLDEGRKLKIMIRDPSGGSHTLGPYQLQADLADDVMAWLRAAWNDRREGCEEPAAS